MSQTWTGSLVEMKANIVSGFALNWCINVVVLPILYDKAHPMRSAFLIGCVFTVVSVCRQLFIRRRMDKIKRFQVDDVPVETGNYNRNVAGMTGTWRNGIPVESLGREHA